MKKDTADLFNSSSEKELLLNLSRHIAAIKDKEELLSVLNTQVQKVFPFSHSNIVRFDDEGETFSAFLNDPDSVSQHHAGYSKLLITKWSVHDRLLENVIPFDAPFIFNLTKAAAENYLPEYLIPASESGLVEMVAIRLKTEQKTLGVLSFFSNKPGNFNPYLDVIAGVASQISIAVSNIIAYEIIRSKDIEQETLLYLSSKMAKIRDKEELLSIINIELRKIFYFAHSAITTINKDRQTFSIYLSDPESPSKRHPNYQKHLSSRYLVHDGIYERILQSEEPVIIEYQELTDKVDLPYYMKIHKETGIKESVSVAMFNDKEVWAVLHFFSDQTGGFARHLPLIKGIASHISVAVANTMANYKLQEREKEKEMLLSLSYEMARVRDKDKLLDVINTTLREILYFTHTSIQVIDWKTETFTIFFTDPKSRSRVHDGFDEMINTPWPIHDGVFSKLIVDDEVTILDVEEVVSRPTVPWYVKIHHSVGLKEAASIALYGENEEIFGVFTLYSDRKKTFTVEHRNIIKNVANQISIAVSNIIAHQEVRERDKQKEVLLGISNDMARVRDVKDLYSTLPKKLKELFDYSGLLIILCNFEVSTFKVFLSEGMNAEKLSSSFSKIDGNDAKILLDYLNRVSNTIVLKNIEKILVINEFWKSGYEQLSFMKLQSGNNPIGFLCLLSAGKNSFSEAWLPMLKGISDQVTVAITNILANERIIKQLEEINRYKQQLEQENLYLQQEIETVNKYSEIIGSGPEIQKIYRLISQVAATNSTVLITGETGTGKELVARAIHDSSPRRSKLMIKVNCAALPPHLIESELFGHERGSFTGATERRIGKFELANKSTLFLDEIGELPLELQVKLLRAIQEKEIERVGGHTIISTDVRIIAATNRDLQKEVYEGNFRSDLYYRLNVFPISLPPLRERVSDIPLLTKHFIHLFSKSNKRAISGVSSKVMEEMQSYSWPGNIRELEHLIERSMLLTDGNLIKNILLPGKNGRTQRVSNSIEVFDVKPMLQMEREYILQVLKYCGGRIKGVGGAAELLELPPTTLHSKIKKLGIKKEHY
jgi:transcriptional regulator with GAF, ATPase, and Fis domain